MTSLPADCWPPDPRSLDAVDAATLVVDPAGRIRHANYAAQRLYASPELPLVGERLAPRLFTCGEQAMAAMVGRVLAGCRWSGRQDVTGADGTLHGAEVTWLPLWRGDCVAAVLCVLEDPGSGQASLRDARRLADRLARLARVTAELVMADTVESVTKIVVSQAAEVVGATIASLTMREGEDMLRLLGVTGAGEAQAKRWQRYMLDTPTPASDVIRSGRRLILAGEGAIAARYPHLRDAALGERTIVCLPLRVSTRTIGAVGLSFPGARIVDAAELELLDVMADTCAQALDRIKARDAAARQTAKLTFLADASTELASSLDYQATLTSVARLAVPTFADWCAIDLVEDGRLNRLAVEHTDPAKVALARALEERYPADPDAPTGPWNVMRTGRSELIVEITDEMLVAGAKDPEHLRIARELNLRSALTVPLVARGKVLGVISWVSAESERSYGPDDVEFAEDLAKRAAIAIDNAELHSQTLAAANRLQQAVLPSGMPSVPGWELASYYSPSGRTEIGGDFYDAVPLGDGRLVLVVGDVMGRGVDAAAAMAQIRAAVRAYTAVDPTPRAVLEKLDLMYAQYPSQQMVTIVYLVADPVRDTITVANAGHPPGLILRSDGRTEQLPAADGAPLGTVPQLREQVTVRFHVGDTLLAFTDGLIERRDEDIDRGQERVRAAMAELSAADLQASLDLLAGSLRDPSRDDDVAALVVRRGDRLRGHGTGLDREQHHIA